MRGGIDDARFGVLRGRQVGLVVRAHAGRVDPWVPPVGTERPCVGSESNVQKMCDRLKVE
jgi:hypothetical protein